MGTLDLWPVCFSIQPAMRPGAPSMPSSSSILAQKSACACEIMPGVPATS
jgi:hypothetical protein